MATERKVIPIAEVREVRQYRSFAEWYAANAKFIDPSDWLAWLQVAFETGQESALIDEMNRDVQASGFGELDAYKRGEHGPHHG